MIELGSISIHGYKSIRAADALALNPINILIGANGSGKSNLIDVFSFLSAIHNGHLRQYTERTGGANQILHFGSSVTSEIYIRLAFHHGIVRHYEVRLIAGETDNLVNEYEDFTFGTSPYVHERSDQTQSKVLKETTGEINEIELEDLFRDALSKWRLYHFQDTSSTSPMKKNAKINDNRFLRPDGANLAAYLYLLKAKHESSYKLIRQTIRQVAPFFDDFVLEPLLHNEDMVNLQWLHVGSDDYFDAASLSDGTLRFIAIATLFLQPSSLRPSVILIDEPELGLHPYAVSLLANMIELASHETQVIAATQSSNLVDYFEPEDIIVANRSDGASEFQRLNSEDLQIWLEDYSLGQLWEKNILGGRPTTEQRV